MLKIDDTPIVNHWELHTLCWQAESVLVYPGEEMKHISATLFEATTRVILVLEWVNELTERQVVPTEVFINSERKPMSHCDSESINHADYC